MKLATAKIDVVPTLNKNAMNNIQNRFKGFRNMIGGAGSFFMKTNQSLQLFQSVLNQALEVFNQVKGLTDLADQIGDSADAWSTTVDNALAVRQVFAEKGVGSTETEKMINKLVAAQKEGKFGAAGVNMPVEELLAQLAPRLKGEGGTKIFKDLFGERNLSMIGEFSSFSMKDIEKVKSGSKFKGRAKGVKDLAKSQAEISRIQYESQLDQIAVAREKGLHKAVEQGTIVKERTKLKELQNSSYSSIVRAVGVTEEIRQTLNKLTQAVIDIADGLSNFFQKYFGSKKDSIKKEKVTVKDLYSDPSAVGGMK